MTFPFVLGLVSRLLFVPIVDSKSRELGLLNQDFRIALEKLTFQRNRFVWIWDRFLLFFGGRGISFSDFAALETS